MANIQMEKEELDELLELLDKLTIYLGRAVYLAGASLFNKEDLAEVKKTLKEAKKH